MRLVDRLIRRDAGYWEGQASGAAVLTSSYGSPDREPVMPQLTAFAQQAYGSSSPVFAASLVRMQLFSEARFQFQAKDDKHLFGTQALAKLEQPFGPDTTTGHLLARMEQDAFLFGNAYIWDAPGEDRLVRLRPDWVTIVSEVVRVDPGAWYRRVQGYWFQPPKGTASQPAGFFVPAQECVHWAPIPDPCADFRGMSPLTPAMRDIQGDDDMTRYKIRYLQHNAPQPLDAKVLTPAGWTTMGALKPGDRVTGSDGAPHRVTGVFPQGEQDIYRVTFSGGASAECTNDHLWQVATPQDRERGAHRVMPLKEIRALGLAWGVKSNAPKWSVPLVEPVQFDDPGPLPVEPYLLGALLGDGSFRGSGTGGCGGVSFCAAAHDADEMEATLTPLLPPGMAVSRRDRGGWSEFYFKASERPNPLSTAVRLLGLWNLHGYAKHIPDRYMRASVIDRVALLQGLLDTDGAGSLRQPNTVTFTSTSQVLSEQLADLAASLGGLAKVIRLTRPGVRDQWHVNVKRLPEWITPFRLARKARHYAPPGSRAPRLRYITGIEYVGRKQAQCIRVDTPDSLYVTDGHILTHNTPNIVIRYAQKLQSGTLDALRERVNARYGGPDNAGGTLILDQGADLTLAGNSLSQMDFSGVQAVGTERILADLSVPGVLVGLEPLRGAGRGYQESMQKLANIWARPTWRSACGALEQVTDVPAGNRLWFDTSDIAALQEGEMARAQSALVRSQALLAAVQAGYTHESAVAAVESGDLSQLKAGGAGTPGSSQPVQHLLPQAQPGATADPLPASMPRLPVGSTSAGDGGNGSRPTPRPTSARRALEGVNGHG